MSFSVEIIPGLTLPFYPMRPKRGLPLVRKPNRVKFIQEYLADPGWIVQPKVNGRRAVLGVIKGRAYLFNRHLRLDHADNEAEFAREMPNKTILDGEIVGGAFHPFEVLAVNGRSLCYACTAERVALAYQFTRLLELKWLFKAPTKDWLMNGPAHAPAFDGVVMKRATARYMPGPTATRHTSDWLKCRWV